MRLGSYQLRERIGEGGFARVYHATGPDGEVAIKVLSPIDGTLDPDSVKRFEREIAVLAKVRHPHLVSLKDHGVDPVHGPYLVMPLLTGLTLRDVLPESGLGPEGALRLITPIVQAVGALHAAGLVHRDLKPENVIVSPRGEVTLVDLGLALGLEQSRLTQAGAVAGSVPYMAPEQIEGDPPRPESDVWSLAVLLYELITGMRPFRRKRSGEEVAAILAGAFDAVSEQDARVGPDLDELLRDALARDPEDRPSDAHELLHRVEALLDWSPPAAQREEVVSILTDLSAYQRARAEERLARLHEDADRAATSGDTFAALAMLNRALAYRPEDRRTLSRIESVSAAPSLPPEATATTPIASRTRKVDAHARTQRAVVTPKATPIKTKRPAAWIALGVLATGALASTATYLLTRPDTSDDEEAALTAAETEPETEATRDDLQMTPMEDLQPTLQPALEPTTEAEPAPESTARDPRPIPGFDQLRPIPPHDLADGPELDLGTNIRRPGESLIPARMLGGDPATALQMLEARVEAAPTDPDLKVGRALAYLANNREREGLRDLREISREHPQLASVWGARGFVALRQGNVDEAERFLTRALEIDPADASSLRNRGILRHRRGNRRGAYADLRAALRYDPNDTNAMAELTQIYEKTGHLRDARLLLERVVRLRPRYTQAWIDLSMSQSDPDEALESLGRALQLEPGLPRAINQRCTVLVRAQREAAIEACTAATEALPNNPWTFMHLGLAYYHQGQTGPALRNMGVAIEARPNDPVMLTNRYLVLQHAGRTVEARRDLEAACDMNHEAACNELRGEPEE
ncbi:MAG: protein kinase [Myxococcota bacterium]